ncbi:MAG: CopD family protein [Chlamydiales bacterium]
MAFLKFFHVLFLFIWIGALFILTWMLGYLIKKSDMEAMNCLDKRIYFYLDLPAMILAILFGGLILLFKETNWKAPWLHMKLTFAFLLIMSDMICGIFITKRVQSRLFYRFFHGLISLLLVCILFAVYVLKHCRY